MVNVIIAGGTSPTLGKSITEAILATGKHDIMIYTRIKQQEGEQSTTTFINYGTKHGAIILPVDYNDVTTLTTSLTFHKTHTLISVLKPLSPEESLTYHTNLLHAAQAAGVSRFILSDWSLSPISHSRVDLLAHKQQLHDLGQTHMRNAKSKGEHVVECATIQNGGFLEYFVQGCGDERLQAGLVDDLMLEYIDIAKRKLAIPRNKAGKPARVSMTSLVDIGKYVAAALDLPAGQLTGHVGVAGWTGTYEEVVQMLGELQPGIKLSGVTYITDEECEKVAGEQGKAFQEKMEKTGEFDLDAFKGQMVAQMMACLCGEEEGGGVVAVRAGQAGMLNDLCPDVQVVDFRELLKKAWQK